MSTERYNRVCDLNTSDGAREFLAAIFIHQLQRHDFTTYIEKELAGDFACVLSRYLCTAREAAEAETIRANVAVGDCNDAEALLGRAVSALIHVTECYGLEPETLARIEAIIEDDAQGDRLYNLEHEPIATEGSTAGELARCRTAWEADRSTVFADYWRGWKASMAGRTSKEVIQLTPAEISSGLNRVRWAEGLIKQLPRDHDGRNSWLLNYAEDQECDQVYDRRHDLTSYFGLSYASWLTLPRVLMEAMPDEWKKRIALLLHEYSETYTNMPDYGTTVRVIVGGQMVRTPQWLIDYRHPHREMINELRMPKAGPRTGFADKRMQDDHGSERRHDDA